MRVLYRSNILSQYDGLLAGIVLLRALSAGPHVVLTESPLFLVLLVLAMVERLTAFAGEVAIERDWVTQLSGGLGVVGGQAVVGSGGV